MFRKAIYSGTWYPTSKTDIQKYVPAKHTPKKAIAGICPHAGWIYSGKVAGEVYSHIQPTDIYVLIGPNHSGLGTAVSVFDEGEWQTPLGNLLVHDLLAKIIIKNSTFAQADYAAHIQEHSLEVQLPFIKILNPHARIVPITMADDRTSICKEIGESLAESIKELTLENKVTLIASTDMSHYISSSDAKKADTLALERIHALDPEGLLNIVKKNNISMCGSGPTATVLWASKILGAQNAELLTYTNSGEVSGDYDQVVGYAGLIIT